ncbi:ATP-binding cassette domain-containing protein [Nonomuraea sp. NPDC047897]|uniref:ATP-binding cassette domain-containing protein n=1 Tax=Nonomuraea sp. NPDC047897 TaxID=3364346 RepID=UPI003720D6C4
MLHPQGGAEDGRLPGALTSIATEDARRVGAVLMAVLAAISGLAVSTVVLLRMSVPLGLVVLLGTPALLWLGHLLSKPLERRSEVEQERVHVFAGPLAENLRLARPGADDDDLRAALATVDALTWVEALPDGLATVVGEGGHRLTGAQRQQLALARLVLADPPAAVLDEATAEAGSSRARALERAVERAVDGRTALTDHHPPEDV